MPKEGKELLAAYNQALSEGHNPDIPWAGRDAEGWERFAEDLKPKAKVPPPPPKVEIAPTPPKPEGRAGRAKKK